MGVIASFGLFSQLYGYKRPIMRTFLIILGLLMMSVYSSEAQIREKGNFELMPTIGITGSDFITEDIEGLDDYDARGGVQVGLLVDYYFNDRWSLRSGLSYFPMGVETKGLDYLNIPFNANWHFGKTRRWNINFGLTPGFLVSGNEYDLLKDFQLALSYGIGHKFRLSEKVSLMLDYQALLGLTDIVEDKFQYEFRRSNYGSSLNIGAVIVL